MLVYAKALVPVAVGAVLVVLGYLGVSSDMSVKDALTLAVTAGLVWLIPNKKK